MSIEERTDEVELRFPEPLMPCNDRGTGRSFFADIARYLSQSRLEDDTARYSQASHDQHQTLHSARSYTHENLKSKLRITLRCCGFVVDSTTNRSNAVWAYTTRQ